MGETAGVFEVADGEFADSVVSVVPVRFHHRGAGVVPVGVVNGFGGGRLGVILSGMGLVAPVCFL